MENICRRALSRASGRESRAPDAAPKPAALDADETFHPDSGTLMGTGLAGGASGGGGRDPDEPADKKVKCVKAFFIKLGKIYEGGENRHMKK